CGLGCSSSACSWWPRPPAPRSCCRRSPLLVPAVPLLVPVAVALARTRLLVRVLALTPIVLFGLWFGAYSLSGSTAYSPADPGPRVPYRRNLSRRRMGVAEHCDPS